ncbi:MAG: elongation factor P [Phototrophicales bacterium]|nr:MAG: elongation factor P [Phototrophicales bacterium]RMG74103.1 MAG: elongation factor P [Chloroflexota bacterium]
MIDVNQLRRGTTYTDDGELLKVLNYQHIKTGRGGGTVRVTVRNLRTGSTVEKTYNTGSRVQDVRLEAVEMEYLFDDGEFLHFMDNETFEQPQIRKDIFGDDIYYMKEGTVIKLLRYEGELIDYELPSTMDFTVVEAENAVAGDTANNPTKKVTTDTGLVVTVPMFVKEGDVIRVKTEDGSYQTRV